MRLIDADKLKGYINANFAGNMRKKSVLTSIDEQPTIDAAEVPLGCFCQRVEEKTPDAQRRKEW